MDLRVMSPTSYQTALPCDTALHLHSASQRGFPLKRSGIVPPSWRTVNCASGRRVIHTEGYPTADPAPGRYAGRVDDSTGGIQARKMHHLQACLEPHSQYQTVTTGLDSVPWPYSALPEVDLAAVQLRTTFLGRRLAAPVPVSYTHLTLPTIYSV